jgi:hypothetical protein
LLADTSRVPPHRFFLASTLSRVSFGWTFPSAWVTVELNTGDVCRYVKQEVELNFSDAASDLRQKQQVLRDRRIFIGSEFFTLHTKFGVEQTVACCKTVINST